MLHTTSNSKKENRLKCPYIFNLVFSTIITIKIKHVEKEKSCPLHNYLQKEQQKTKTLLCKEINRLQKFDFVFLIRRIQK